MVAAINSSVVGNSYSFSSQSSISGSSCMVKGETLPSLSDTYFSCLLWFRAYRFLGSILPPLLSCHGYKYSFTFIDDFIILGFILSIRNTLVWCFLIPKEFVTLIVCPIKTLYSISGGKYMSSQFQSFLKDKGIESQCSRPYTSQQNGVDERKNQLILVTVWALVLFYWFIHFWSKAIQTIVCLIT